MSDTHDTWLQPVWNQTEVESKVDWRTGPESVLCLPVDGLGGHFADEKHPVWELVENRDAPIHKQKVQKRLEDLKDYAKMKKERISLEHPKSNDPHPRPSLSEGHEVNKIDKSKLDPEHTKPSAETKPDVKDSVDGTAEAKHEEISSEVVLGKTSALKEGAH